ncbi:unnamed protein product, partial [Rotaria sp. Silwood2]
MSEICVQLVKQTTEVDNVQEKVLNDTLDFTNELILLVNNLRDKCLSKIDFVKNNRGT